MNIAKKLLPLVSAPWFFPCLLFAGIAAYYAYCFFAYAFTAIPSEDFIGNFRPFIKNLTEGKLLAVENKLFPAYPLLLAGASALMPESSGDAIYWAALLLNMLFIFPFLFFAYKLFVKFLGRRFAFFALLLLSVNLYTLYSLLNPELEVFLCFISCLSLYLMSQKASSQSQAIPTLGAAVTASVKGDCLFMIPAAALNAFKKKSLKAGIATGIFAALPICLWFVFRLLYDVGGNTYINEVAERGPNIWKYPIECILASAGFPKWALLSAYNGGSLLNRTALCLTAAAFLLIAAGSLFLGIRALIKLKESEKLPLIVFVGGFFLIHILYQNTKDRYVIPILYVLLLLICLGFKSFYPKLQSLSGRSIWYVLTGALSLYSFAILAFRQDIVLLLFALFLHILIFAFFLFRTGMSSKQFLPLCFFIGSLCSLNIGFGQDAMLHFGQRRAEFKEAALWFAENAEPNDRILLTDASVFGYYADKERTASTGDLASSNSSDTEELLKELSEKKINYVFIDDFYISRLLLKDPNAVSRKAPLMQKLRNEAPCIRGMSLIKTFKTYTGSSAFLYRYRP